MTHRRVHMGRGHRGQIQKSMMAICRTQFWFVIFVIFAFWSLLVYLNYSSMINGVTLLAKYYVYSTNQDESFSFQSSMISIQNDSVLLENDNHTVSEITGVEDEGDHNNVNGVVDRKELASNETASEVGNDVEVLQMRVPKKRSRRRGRRHGKGSIARKSARNLPNNQQGSRRENVVEWNSNLEMITKPESPPLSPSPSLPPLPLPPPPKRECAVAEVKSSPESCSGRYIYVHTLPRRYNVDLLRDCKSLDLWMDMCQYIKNSGLGPPLPDSETVFSEFGWYATNQFLLEVIFHNRMKQYDCLTNDSSEAAAVFVPFYAGLDVAKNLWNTDAQVRDSSSLELVKWLRHKPEWKRFWGRDHFFVAGRITWDFRRSENRKDPDWGTKFLYLPESRNMTALVIESSPWNNNDFGIPYPTYFHPSSDDQVIQWQNRMRKQRRKYLFSFAGAPRPDRPDSIRNQIITQCENARGKCNLIHCNNWKNKCHKPAELMKVFQSSNFCLQPPGDSYTRRSTFDTILAGCIPVFFHPGSSYIQYLWHFPQNYTKYSVFISMYDVRDGKVSIERVLQQIPIQRIWAMREEVIRVIPKIIYADPRCRLESIEDAFDLAVKGVLGRVGKIKEDIREGRNSSFAYDERTAWKYSWVGKLEEHEWDPYFSGTFEYQN